MSSGALLSVLLSLGVAVIAVLWGLNEARSGGGASALEEMQRAADADINTLQNELDRVRSELERLKDEAANARSDLEFEKKAVAELLAEKERLIARLDSHMAGGKPGADGRDWTDEEIDLRNKTEILTVRIREHTMTSPLGYRFSDWDGMRAALAKHPSLVPEAQAAQQSRAYAAMGFVPEGTDVRARTLDFLEGQLGAALYTGDRVMLFNSEGTTKSIHDRTALATQVVHYIQDGNYKTFEKLREVPDNNDARLALWSLAVGDANLVKIRFQLQDTTAAAADELLQSPTKMTREQFERIPAFLRETLLFPYALGDRFAQKLHEKDRWGEIDKALERPPFTTTQILHPELFNAEKEFAPEEFEALGAKAEVGGLSPIWNDVAGELRIALLLNQTNFLQRMAELGQPDILDMPELVSKGYEHFAEREGSKAAAGWLGDRFLVYGAAEAGESIYWRSKWSTAEDAEAFATAIKKSLAFRHKIEAPANGDWSVGGKSAVKVAMLAGNQVLVIDAADAAFGKTLESHFATPAP